MSKARTVPSSDAETRNLLLLANVTAVTLDECSWNVRKQNPDCMFHSFTWIYIATCLLFFCKCENYVIFYTLLGYHTRTKCRDGSNLRTDELILELDRYNSKSLFRVSHVLENQELPLNFGSWYFLRKSINKNLVFVRSPIVSSTVASSKFSFANKPLCR